MTPPPPMANRTANLLDLDLNLLVALDALLSERSVTGAARLLHRSQPALSASLKRLRHHFGDDLLLRVGNHHELTPLAGQLEPRLALVLADLDRLFSARARFDPGASSREFVIHTADYGQMLLGEAIATELAAEAPGMRLRFHPLTDVAIGDASGVLRTVDGFIVPRGFLEGLPHLDTFTDRWVLLVDRANRSVGDTVSLGELSGLTWVLPYHHRVATVPAVQQLRMLGVALDVAVAVDGFLALPRFIAGTERITIIQERLASLIAPASAFRTIECPFEAAPLVESLWWHPALERDPGHAWFRSIVERAGHRVAERANPPPRPPTHRQDL